MTELVAGWEDLDETGLMDDVYEEMNMFMKMSPVAKGNYVKGKKDGHWTLWYPSGHKWQEGLYQDDLKHGSWIIFSESGHKVSEGSYHRGKRHGPWTFWLEGGKLPTRCRYDHGVLVDFLTGESQAA